MSSTPAADPCRSKFGTEEIGDLEYSLCLAPIAEEVAAEEELKRELPPPSPSDAASPSPVGTEGEDGEDGGAGGAQGPVSPGQGFTAKAALLLWMWLERECAG